MKNTLNFIHYINDNSRMHLTTHVLISQSAVSKINWEFLAANPLIKRRKGEQRNPVTTLL